MPGPRESCQAGRGRREEHDGGGQRRALFGFSAGGRHRRPGTPRIPPRGSPAASPRLRRGPTGTAPPRAPRAGPGGQAAAGAHPAGSLHPSLSPCIPPSILPRQLTRWPAAAALFLRSVSPLRSSAGSSRSFCRSCTGGGGGDGSGAPPPGLLQPRAGSAASHGGGGGILTEPPAMPHPGRAHGAQPRSACPPPTERSGAEPSAEPRGPRTPRPRRPGGKAPAGAGGAAGPPPPSPPPPRAAAPAVIKCR